MESDQWIRKLKVKNSYFSNIYFSIYIGFKETVCIISSHPPCRDGNTRFTTVPMKP